MGQEAGGTGGNRQQEGEGQEAGARGGGGGLNT